MYFYLMFKDITRIMMAILIESILKDESKPPQKKRKTQFFKSSRMVRLKQESQQFCKETTAKCNTKIHRKKAKAT